MRYHNLIGPALLAVAISLPCCGASKSPASPAAKGALGDFSLKDVDGKTVSLSDYLGKNVIVISFWATWCEPCKRELVKLDALYRSHRSDGLVVIAVSMDEPESRGDVRPYVKQRGFEFPVLIDAESMVTNRYNPSRAAPYNMIIDRGESIVWTHEGYVPGDEAKLEEAVVKVISAGGGAPK